MDLFNMKNQNVTIPISAAMFVCVEQATQGHQWRPIGNYNP